VCGVLSVKSVLSVKCVYCKTQIDSCYITMVCGVADMIVACAHMYTSVYVCLCVRQRSAPSVLRTTRTHSCSRAGTSCVKLASSRCARAQST